MVRHLLLVTAFHVIACGGNKPPPPVQNAAPPEPVAAKPVPKDDGAMAVAKMTAYADRMCTCIDKQCADVVMTDMTTWAEEMAKQSSDKPADKPTEADMKRMTEVASRFAECMSKAMGGTP